MVISGILRVVTLLCLLVVAFHSPISKAGNDFNFRQPSTVKDAIDLLGKLVMFTDDAKVPEKVAEAFDKNVQEYLNTKGIPGGNTKRNIKRLLKGITKLRKILLKNPKALGKYSDLTESDVDACVHALIRWLPTLHSELWFLYFQTADIAAKYSGGSWKEQKFGPSHSTTQLHQWLTSKGFKPRDLHEYNLGSNIAVEIGIKINQGGLLNYAQYGLFFLSPTWHDSNLGSAVLFLQEYCDMVNAKKFYSYDSFSTTDPLQPLCKSLSTGLKSLTDELHPLYCGSVAKNPYKGMLKPEAFLTYTTWLRVYLQNIMTSLSHMAEESKHWTSEILSNTGSPGPFKYGFVFKDKGWSVDSVYYILNPTVSILTASDSGLLSVLHKTVAPEVDLPNYSLDQSVEASSSTPDGESNVPSATVCQSSVTIEPQSPGISQPQIAHGSISEKSSALTEAFTVKEFLDLLGRLEISSIKAQVLGMVHQKIKAYLRTTGITGENVENNLTKVLDTVPELRKRFLKNPHNYGNYANIDPSEGSIAKYADIVTHWLPLLHNELWHLYYQIAEEGWNLGGGAWRNQRFGQSHGTTQLHRWFTDQLERKAIPLIPKGFSTQDLIDNGQGNNITSSIGINFEHGESLNYAQYGLFLLSPWHDSNLGSAVLFLQEFCGQVHNENGIFKDKLSDEKHGALTCACYPMSTGLTLLGDILQPLYSGSTDTYKGKLRPESLGLYVDWLGRHLDSLKRSFEQMLSESSEWTSEILSNTGSPGPFKYGFVFKDAKWEESLRYKLPIAITTLTGQACTGSLSAFSNCVTPNCTNPVEASSSTPDGESK